MKSVSRRVSGYQTTALAYQHWRTHTIPAVSPFSPPDTRAVKRPAREAVGMTRALRRAYASGILSPKEP
jgi:hypothetical protein